MRKWILTLITLFTVTASAKAMSYDQAREQALFLADKMAYELNLTEDQYEAAYEINLDYLMSVNNYDDLYGSYWRQRNLDLSYVLLDWQYRAYCAASYFYRPLYWTDGIWHFGIYSRYPRRSFYYYGRPGFFTVYVGGHSWRHNGGRSWYRGREWGRPVANAGGRDVHFGMRDGYKRGDYRNGFNGARQNPGSTNFGNRNRNNNAGNVENRQNSGFRINQQQGNTNRGTISFGGRRPSNTTTDRANTDVQNRQNSTVEGRRTTTTARPSSTRTTVRNFGSRPSNSSSFGGSRGSSTQTTPARSFSPSTRSSSSTVSRPSVSRPSGSGSSSGSRSGGSGGHFGGRR